MTEKKSGNSRKLYYILGTAVLIIGIFASNEARIDSKIANHPKIVTLENEQSHILNNQKEMKEMLENLDEKVDSLNMKMRLLLHDNW